MDIRSAKEILRVLADGNNPSTGEPLPEDSLYNNPEIIRDLYTVLENLKNNDKIRQPLPENAGKSWSQQDDERLCMMFDDGISIKELSEHFKRTRGAITSRLVRLGKVER